MPWIFITPTEFQMLTRYAHGFFQTSKLVNDGESKPIIEELEKDYDKVIEGIQKRNVSDC